MWPKQVIVLASLVAASQLPTANHDQGKLSWGATWPTSYRKSDSLEVVVFGSRSSIRVNIAASNRGNVPIQVVVPILALAFEISNDQETVSGRLTCADGVEVHRRKQDVPMTVETLTSKVMTLAPEEALESRCEIARVDGQPITPGHYRVSATTPGWQLAAFSETFWTIEIRDPSTAAERRLLHFTEGNELFLQHDYTEAAKEFELARAAEPGDVRTTMALASAYERLTRYSEAAALLEGLLPLAQQHALDEALTQVLIRQLAINYVADRREDQASRLLLGNGFTPDKAGAFITTARATHANPR